MLVRFEHSEQGCLLAFLRVLFLSATQTAGGVQNRSRFIAVAAKGEGVVNCTGDASQTQGCNNDDCPLDCQYEACGSVAIILLRKSAALNRLPTVAVTFCFLMLFAHRREAAESAILISRSRILNSYNLENLMG